MSEATLRQRTEREKKELLAHIFSAEFEYVCRSLRRLGVFPGDVEDLAQEVFVTVYQKLDALDDARPIRPWLFGFAVRLAANYRRLARHSNIPEQDAEFDMHTTEGPDKATLDSQRRQIVINALDKIAFDQRTVLIMHDIDGSSAPEIAGALSIPVNTVYSRLRLARQKFKLAIGGWQPAREALV